MISQWEVINHNLVTVIKRLVYLIIKISGLKSLPTFKVIDFQSEGVWFESCFCDIAYNYCNFVVFFYIYLFIFMTFPNYFVVGVEGYLNFNAVHPFVSQKYIITNYQSTQLHPIKYSFVDSSL